MRFVALIVLSIATAILPHHGRTFFAALGALDPEEASSLQQRHVVNGLLAQLRDLFVSLLTALGLAAVVAASIPF